MWGDRNTMEDKYAWAHHTGVTVVEHIANTAKFKDLVANLRYLRWRSLSLEKKKAENQVTPSLDSKATVMAMLISLHEKVGPKTIGEAMNQLNEEEAGHRINHVRYYRFDDLKDALEDVIEDREKRDAVSAVFP